MGGDQWFCFDQEKFKFSPLEFGTDLEPYRGYTERYAFSRAGTILRYSWIGVTLVYKYVLTQQWQGMWGHHKAVKTIVISEISREIRLLLQSDAVWEFTSSNQLAR